MLLLLIDYKWNKVMKANKAPEKIYLEAIYPDNGVLPNGLNYTPSPTDIEYTRTDAFIEKEAEYLMEYEFNDSPTIADRRKRVDEFRKYMEGEKV